jgi:secreted PhoX family phosphatase
MNDDYVTEGSGSIPNLEPTPSENPEALDINMDEPQQRWSANPDFQEVLMSRRGLLQGGVALAVTGILASGSTKVRAGDAWSRDDSSLGFSAVPSSSLDAVAVPPGYSVQVILPMGTPITGSYPEYSIDNTGAEMGMQIGSLHVGMHFFTLPAVFR